MLDVHQLSVSYGKHLALDGVSLTRRPRRDRGHAGCQRRRQVVLPEGAGRHGAAHAGRPHHASAAPTSPPCRRTRWSRPGWRWCRRIAASSPISSVRENLLLGAFPPRARTRTRRRTCKRVLTLFPRLAERMGQLARTMSGGERQMVAIGRALMSSPDILLLDEPSLGLSPLVCKELFQALARIKELGVGVLLVEQNATQSLAIAGRGYLLENGRIVGEGAAARAAGRSGRAPRLSGRRANGGSAPAARTAAEQRPHRPHTAASAHRRPRRRSGTCSTATLPHRRADRPSRRPRRRMPPAPTRWPPTRHSTNTASPGSAADVRRQTC